MCIYCKPFLPSDFGSIVIKGSNTITLDDVLFEAKIKTPVNTLRVSGSAIEDALSHDYRVEKVNVTRVFPLTIDVDITDRIPWLLCRMIMDMPLLIRPDLLWKPFNPSIKSVYR